MANPRAIWKCSILSFVIFYCMTGVAEIFMISYVLLRRFSIRFFLESLRLPILVSFVAPLIVFLTAYIGWHSVSNIKPRLIKTFSVLLTIAVTIEIAESIWSFAAQQEFPRLLTLSLTEKFERQFFNNTTDWWDVLQSDCCGINGSSDYISLHEKVPASCFRDNKSHFGGCYEPLKEIGTQDFGTISLAFLIIACLQLPGIFVSWCFANRMGLAEI